MTELKATPGPWTAEGASVYALVDIRPEDYRAGWPEKVNRMSLGITMYPRQADCEPGEAKANAHLIAAAPELYGLLQLMLTHGERCNWFADRGDYELVEEAEKLLSKARGETE